MQELPAESLRLYDQDGSPFGAVRFSVTRTEPLAGDCIFDLDDAPSERNEVRWLAKRHYRLKGEHRFKVQKDGTLRVSSGDFEVIFEPADGQWRTQPPAPRVTAFWVD